MSATILPPNARPVTKREIALGLLSKPAYPGDYSCERYMSDGEIVNFQVLKRNSDFNAEFTINGDPSKKIWLSQLNQLYLAVEGRSLYCGKIVFKGLCVAEHKPLKLNASRQVVRKMALSTVVTHHTWNCIVTWLP